jgi:hypothetical protein
VRTLLEPNPQDPVTRQHDKVAGLEKRVRDLENQLVDVALFTLSPDNTNEGDAGSIAGTHRTGETPRLLLKGNDGVWYQSVMMVACPDDTPE